MSGSASILERVRNRLIDEAAEPSAAGVARALRAEGIVLGDDAVMHLVTDLRSELAGAGPLEPLLRLPGVTDILVNGPDDVWVECDGALQRTGVRFPDEAAVRRLAQRLAAAAGRRLDEAAPCVDARLADGIRMHAVLPPVSTTGTLISLRIPPDTAFTLDDLVAAGSIDDHGAALLEGLVRARAAFLVSGGTGAGKTTILGTLLGLVPPSERIVIVEDSAELRPSHPHVVRMEARPPNVEGAGAVPLRSLVREALRMRPDRLVVGEVRGAEVVDLLSALNTGHEGGCGTVHANSADDVPVRLEALGLAAGLPRSAIHALMGAALDAVIHLGRDGEGRRRVEGIHACVRDAQGFTRSVPGFVAAGPGPDAQGRRLLAREGAAAVESVIARGAR